MTTLSQTERTIDRSPGGKKRILVTLSSIQLALVTGLATIQLNDLKEVTDFFPHVVTPAGKNDYVFEYQFAKSATAVKNGIDITVNMMQTSAVSPTWGVAATADIASVKIMIECYGI